MAFCSWPEKEGTPLEGKISSEASQEEVLEQFAGWEDEAQQILQVGRPQSHSQYIYILIEFTYAFSVLI